VPGGEHSWQAQQIAAGYELTLDPPDAGGAEAGRPQLDEDYLILSNIHSVKGQEWDAVFVLNPVDGCIPSAAPQVRQKGPFKGQIGRSLSRLPYYIVGWSYRLFPPQGACEAEPNRGSAFNSCLAMSSVETVDRVYLISKGGVFRFKKSTAEEV
jgi:hypothetical protein